MNNQLSHYISIEPDFFQELEGEFSLKMKFLCYIIDRRKIEMIAVEQ